MLRSSPPLDLKKPIALTLGEPAGIGPDILIQLLRNGRLPAPLHLFGDLAALSDRATLLGYDIAAALTQHGVAFTDIPYPSPITLGKPNPEHAATLMKGIDCAITACLQNECAAWVTGPVQKASIHEAGIPFTGHTEYIAAQCGRAHPVMMLVNDHLKVALATTHLPLSEVPQAITTHTLQQILTTLHTTFSTQLAIPNPHLLVCGLNPHAGEYGLLGSEDREVIEPALAACRRAGMHITGPVPADTAFTPHAQANCDVTLAMYHDQGLPIVKSAGIDQVVNITLGLPIVRTSVGHGVALPLAGTGQASPQSLYNAILWAAQLAQAPQAQVGG